MFIYKLTNTINNKIYIGLTTEKSIDERCRKRNAEAKYRSERNSYMLNAIRKYGSDVFSVEQIDTANSLEELKQKEIYYIALYNSTDRNIGYNLTKGGEGNLGLKMSDETKDKIRKKRLGTKWTIEQKEAKKKAIKEGSIKLNISQAIKNCELYNLKTSKRVEQFDLLGNSLNIFNSISEAALKTFSDRSGIMKYLNSNKAELGKTYKGFIYKIKED